MRLFDLAHARCGDKGDTASICVVAYRREDYPRLARALTVDRVKAHFGDRVRGEVERYELPGLGALNFVLHGALAGGVTRSLGLDAHGKSLSSALLALELDEDGAGRDLEGAGAGGNGEARGDGEPPPRDIPAG